MVNGKEEYPESPDVYVLDLGRMLGRRIRSSSRARK